MLFIAGQKQSVLRVISIQRTKPAAVDNIRISIHFMTKSCPNLLRAWCRCICRCTLQRDKAGFRDRSSHAQLLTCLQINNKYLRIVINRTVQRKIPRLTVTNKGIVPPASQHIYRLVRLTAAGRLAQDGSCWDKDVQHLTAVNLALPN